MSESFWEMAGKGLVAALTADYRLLPPSPAPADGTPFGSDIGVVFPVDDLPSEAAEALGSTAVPGQTLLLHMLGPADRAAAAQVVAHEDGGWALVRVVSVAKPGQ